MALLKPGQDSRRRGVRGALHIMRNIARDTAERVTTWRVRSRKRPTLVRHVAIVAAEAQGEVTS